MPQYVRDSSLLCCDSTRFCRACPEIVPPSSCVWVETSSPAVSLEFQARPKLDPLPPLLVACLTCPCLGAKSVFARVPLHAQPLQHHSTSEQNRVQSYIYPKTLLRVSFDFGAALPYLHQGCVSITGQQTETRAQGTISLIASRLHLHSASHAALGRVATVSTV